MKAPRKLKGKGCAGCAHAHSPYNRSFATGELILCLCRMLPHAHLYQQDGPRCPHFKPRAR